MCRSGGRKTTADTSTSMLTIGGRIYGRGSSLGSDLKTNDSADRRFVIEQLGPVSADLISPQRKPACRPEQRLSRPAQPW